MAKRASIKSEAAPAPPSLMTKAGVANSLVERAAVQGVELGRRQADAALEALAALVHDVVAIGGKMAIPGVARVAVKVRPATKERAGVSPLTKAPITIAAKPERRAVKLTPIKAIKDAAG